MFLINEETKQWLRIQILWSSKIKTKIRWKQKSQVGRDRVSGGQEEVNPGGIPGAKEQIYWCLSKAPAGDRYQNTDLIQAQYSVRDWADTFMWFPPKTFLSRKQEQGREERGKERRKENGWKEEKEKERFEAE